MRRFGLAVALCLLPVLGHAQDRTQTLADIRAELGALAAEFNALKAELVSSGAAASGAAGGDALTRMDTIEAELARLTARTEEVELKLNRVVADGTNRIGDIEYRLCEVTEGCDPANLGATTTLGGDTGGAAAPVVDVGAAPATDTTGGAGGAELAVAEQQDFDRAK
ncbi:MAG: tol-pal system protein, partial [Pseudomonadota bacterium]